LSNQVTISFHMSKKNEAHFPGCHENGRHIRNIQFPLGSWGLSSKDNTGTGCTDSRSHNKECIRASESASRTFSTGCKINSSWSLGPWA
jgi:hypothetical protein